MVHFLSLSSVCVNDRNPPPHMTLTDHNSEHASCVASILVDPNDLQKIRKTYLAFGIVLVSLCLFSSSSILALFSCTQHKLFTIYSTGSVCVSPHSLSLSLFQIMFESALWVRVRATGGGGRWQWLGSCARPGPHQSLMNTSKNRMHFSPQCQTK